MSNPISFDNNDSRMGYECNNGSERNNSSYHNSNNDYCYDDSGNEGFLPVSQCPWGMMYSGWWFPVFWTLYPWQTEGLWPMMPPCPPKPPCSPKPPCPPKPPYPPKPPCPPKPSCPPKPPVPSKPQCCKCCFRYKEK